MPSQSRSRANRAQGLDRKPTAEQREEIRRAAAERDEQLAALKDEYIPRARELHLEYAGKRNEIFQAYDERRRQALLGATDIAPAVEKVKRSIRRRSARAEE